MTSATVEGVPTRFLARVFFACALCDATCLAVAPLQAQAATSPASTKADTMHPTGGHIIHATGTFQINLKPEEPSETAKAADVGRTTYDKTWSGEITGTSKGEMLSGMTKVTGSMSYVALERMGVTIAGRSGTFLLQHMAYMQAGTDPSKGTLNISVVQGSGTGALAGISGTLRITITDKVHHYDFAYELPADR